MVALRHIYLDFSSIDLYRQCPLKFKRTLVDALVPTGDVDESTKTTFKGTLIHAALDAHSKGQDPFKCMDSLIYAPGVKAISELSPDKSGSVEHMHNLLKSYLDHYAEDKLTYLRTEQRMEMVLAPWLTYVGNVDKEALLENERVIVDHKTSSSLKAWVEPQVAVSDQFTGYLALAQANGINTSTLIVDGISTAKKAYDSGDGLYVRYTAYRTNGQIESWRRRTLDWAQKIKTSVETDFFNTNQPKACTDFGGRCPFYEVCACEGSCGRNILASSFVKNSNPWHSFKVVYE